MTRLLAFLRRHVELSAIVPVLLALLAGPVTEITGAHVNAFLRALHAAKMEELLAPPKAEAGAETGAV